VTADELVAKAIEKGLLRPKVVPYKPRSGPVLYKLKFGPNERRIESMPDTLDKLAAYLDQLPEP
jgi:hypothetical protein